MLAPPLNFLISIIMLMVSSSDPQAYNLKVAFNQHLLPPCLLSKEIYYQFFLQNVEPLYP